VKISEVEDFCLVNKISSTTGIAMPAVKSSSLQGSNMLDARWREEIVRCFWMALGGRTDDLSRYLERMLPKWKERDAGLAEGIEALLHKPSHSGLERRVPNGSDNRRELTPAVEVGVGTELVRIENPVSLVIEPVWPAGVADELESLIAERKAVAQLQKVGLAPTKTAIFTGPPGVGKTLAARWVARELGLPLASLNLTTVMSSFLGRTGANLNQVMSYAASHPCVLFLDEIDAVAKRRDDASDVGELKRLVTVLLQEIDAWPAGGLLLAATNHEQLLDPAVWRRFERRVVFSAADSQRQGLLLERILLSEWTKLDAAIRSGIAVAATILSPSDLSQVATRSLRDMALGLGPLEERLIQHLQNALSLHPLAERRRAGFALKAAGHGQREISRLTGLARETIRALPQKPQKPDTQ
jgi:hypothetical protein